MEEITKKYSNDEVTIIWQPAKCIHSTICWKGASGLLSVFNPKERPWIKPQGASTEDIINKVKQCPSGALSYEYLQKPPFETQKPPPGALKIEIKPNGPLILHGNCILVDSEGKTTSKDGITAFCRCGHSSNKPFCDGSHRKENFIG